MVPAPVSCSQQTPCAQLFVPEQASVSPLQAAAVVQKRPVRVAQHTWVNESHTVCPHTIWSGPPSDFVPPEEASAPEDPEEMPPDELPDPDELDAPDELAAPEEPPDEASSPLLVPLPLEEELPPDPLPAPSALPSVAPPGEELDPPHAAPVATTIETTRKVRLLDIEGLLSRPPSRRPARVPARRIYHEPFRPSGVDRTPNERR
jgi:hypothetical protein